MESKPTALTHPDVHVVRGGPEPKPRLLFRLDGVSPSVSVGLFNNSVVNLSRAVLERLYHEKVGGVYRRIVGPLSKEHYWASLAAFRRRLVTRLDKAIPMTRDEFVESYVGDRRQPIYEEAAQSLLARGFNIRRDRRVKTFTKGEKTPFANRHLGAFYSQLKIDPVPRAISPRDPRYTVELGRFLKPAEKRIYGAVDAVFNAPTVAKGRNNWERAQILRGHWESFSDPVAFKVDAHRFEAHATGAALRWSHVVYRDAIVDGWADLSNILQAQLYYEACGYCADGRVSYLVRHGMRASGDFDTALGNSLLTAAMWWSYARHMGIRIRFLCDGDDGVVVLSARDAPRFQGGVTAWFANMGFVMDVAGPVSQFEKIVFCSCQPVEVFTGKWLMTRDPRMCLMKDTTSMVHWDCELSYKRWLAAVGDGGEALAGCLPVLGELYASFKRTAGGVSPIYHPSMDSGFSQHVRMMGKERLRYGKPTDAARVSFWAAFGIAPNEQEAIESDLRLKTYPWAEPRDLGSDVRGAEYCSGTVSWPGF